MYETVIGDENKSSYHVQQVSDKRKHFCLSSLIREVRSVTFMWI